jgi:alpha-tubulin suppressor-like RCC1 family protein
VSLGSGHSAAIKTDGTLWLWGSGACGRLGDNSTVNRSSPVQTVSGGNNWRSVSLGNAHSAAIKTDGTLWLWGSGTFGLLGNGANIFVMTSPIQTVSGGNEWRSVSLGTSHSAATCIIEY